MGNHKLALMPSLFLFMGTYTFFTQACFAFNDKNVNFMDEINVMI